MNAINNHHSLWNSEQEGSYIRAADEMFGNEWDTIISYVESTGMVTNQNLISEFKAQFSRFDIIIMEATGLAYVGI